MAKKQTGAAAEEPLRRTCGAMAAHMMLLERFPSFRASQMRLEGATNKRRETAEDMAQAKIVTIKTVVNVVYNTDQQNISTSQIDSQIAVLNITISPPAGMTTRQAFNRNLPIALADTSLASAGARLRPDPSLRRRSRPSPRR